MAHILRITLELQLNRHVQLPLAGPYTSLFTSLCPGQDALHAGRELRALYSFMKYQEQVLKMPLQSILSENVT